ncbi:site-specific DNA-methyltransferase [Helicobacter pylori]|uniref:site-specific DNA-methyltransferase n=1 Tax=Helicobacter pylori TaxID=210 RepID=UPI0011C8B63E|nr:site-specific DNA-methyltransferase [Helicobacter pylori]QEF22062.1 site-specific DNA-methyltransferase [Helicobacter pylori]QEF25849.1 site-specific DNA-methyltransferase [Helicobacter pylori]
MLKTPLKTLLDILINHFTKERLVTLILQHDEKLLIFMLEHENANDYKNAFFKTIANTLVFNEKALLECLEIKELENSFTRFKNKIGLYSQGGLIKSSELVVLNFPFKDNVLLGNAKDNNTKSNELFYHEILHKNEIDTLLHKKALCRFEMHGQGDLESALKDENTNYLIKGNNLIALHSLKKKFAKQVKCIYIDPPYNTGNDSFNYNDNFNHSSWLVFMKNRLEAAREFLSDDGVIFVQCDDNEQAYLKVLMDEIFLRENFVASISWKQFHSVKNDAANFSKNIEYILCYCKNFSKNLISNEPFDKSNSYKLKDENGFYKLDPVWAKSGNNFSPYTFPNGKTWSPPSGTFWRYSIGTLKDMEQNNRIVFNGKNPMAKRYLSEVAEGRKSSTFWDGSEVGYNLNGDAEIKQLFNGNKVFNNPKPEALISRILEISTNENDLVLDFFAGSGTTCAVAHKMKRRYIGIEQMDYIETITKERLKKVIEGEQGGISKKCGFKGGGSFVYAELKEVNLEIKKQITNAKSASECLKIFNDLSERFLKRTDNKMDEIHSEEFQNLDLNEQKRIYCTSLDSNEDYLNLGDIDEDAWEIDEITKKYNEIFYS